MNPYIGDRPLDPPENDECETCDGSEWILVREGMGFEEVPCPSCQYDKDPGEPNQEPDLLADLSRESLKSMGCGLQFIRGRVFITCQH